MVAPIVIDTTLISASIADAGKLSANSSVEDVDSAFFSSSSSSSADESLPVPATAKPKRLNSFNKLFKKAHPASSASPASPLSPSPPSSPDHKMNVLKGVFGQNPGGKHCDLNRKYGVCDKGCIGKGATAIVRLAHKLDKSGSEKLYAVKEFRQRRKNETEKEYVKKLTSEFCISSSMRHPNVVETVDLVKDKKGGWVEVMEYVPADLHTVIKSGHMTGDEIDCCFKQLVHGVAYMHSMGVAHRDLKPENLLLSEHGQLKITDFGVSDVFRISWEKQAHLSKGLCGSVPYIAPEEFVSKEYDAQLVDVWSIGIIYYSMKNQGIPFRSAQPSDPHFEKYLQARATRSFAAFETLDRPCRDLIYRILDPDAKTRITIAEILKNDWFRSIEVCNDCQVSTGEHHHILDTKTKY